MIAAVSIGLWMADIVLFPQDFHAGNGADEGDGLVNILGEGADQAHPRRVPDVLQGAVTGDGEALPRQLFPHTGRALDPGLDRGYGVPQPLSGLIPAHHAQTGEKFGDDPLQQNECPAIKFPVRGGEMDGDFVHEHPFKSRAAQPGPAVGHRKRPRPVSGQRPPPPGPYPPSV